QASNFKEKEIPYFNLTLANRKIFVPKVIILLQGYSSSFGVMMFQKESKVEKEKFKLLQSNTFEKF
ncbi:16302_t:CDS:2, partial [Acaulospora morrowiae]